MVTLRGWKLSSVTGTVATRIILGCWRRGDRHCSFTNQIVFRFDLLKSFGNARMSRDAKKTKGHCVVTVRFLMGIVEAIFVTSGRVLSETLSIHTVLDPITRGSRAASSSVLGCTRVNRGDRLRGEGIDCFDCFRSCRVRGKVSWRQQV